MCKVFSVTESESLTSFFDEHKQLFKILNTEIFLYFSSLFFRWHSQLTEFTIHKKLC